MHTLLRVGPAVMAAVIIWYLLVWSPEIRAIKNMRESTYSYIKMRMMSILGIKGARQYFKDPSETVSKKLLVLEFASDNNAYDRPGLRARLEVDLRVRDWGRSGKFTYTLSNCSKQEYNKTEEIFFDLNPGPTQEAMCKFADQVDRYLEEQKKIEKKAEVVRKLRLL